MRFTRAVGTAGALILAAVVGGTLIGSALATDETDRTHASSYCDTFLDAFASELGVSRDGMTAAAQAAANAAVHAAVAAGDLDEEHAVAIRERIAEFEGTGCGWLHGRGAFGLGAKHGAARGFVGAHTLEAAAEALGLASDGLIGQLREAGSLRALAEAQSAHYDEVRAAVLAAVQADLDAAVADGMPQERADAAIERLTEWLDAGGEVPAGRGFGHGQGHFGGPGGWFSDRFGDTHHGSDDDADDATDAEESGP
ncbi:MAG: hypothetical protein LC798_21040 [Chloroflexi bacterium]|nr:hypothetical protein [Chloroflexota bacterium]